MATERDTKELKQRIVELEREVIMQMRAEKALKEDQRTYLRLIDKLPQMVYRCLNERDWTFEFVSDAVFNLAGYRPPDFSPKGRVSYA